MTKVLPTALSVIAPAETVLGSPMLRPFGSTPSSRSIVRPAVGSWHLSLMSTVPPWHEFGSITHEFVVALRIVPSVQLGAEDVQMPLTAVVPGPHSSELSPQPANAPSARTRARLRFMGGGLS